MCSKVLTLATRTTKHDQASKHASDSPSDLRCDNCSRFTFLRSSSCRAGVQGAEEVSKWLLAKPSPSPAAQHHAHAAANVGMVQ